MNNQPQIFKPNKLKNSMLLLISSVFVAGGILIVKEEPLFGWGSILFFGFGVILSLIQFYPNSSYLRLSKEGFEVKTMFRVQFTKWSDVRDFRKGHINGNKMIFFDYTDEHKKWNNGKKLSKLLSGKEGAIQSIYKIKTSDLLDLMIKWKEKS